MPMTHDELIAHLVSRGYDKLDVISGMNQAIALGPDNRSVSGWDAHDVALAEAYTRQVSKGGPGAFIDFHAPTPQADTKSQPPKQSTVTPPTQAQQIRAWARERGIAVSERGRISREVIDAWRQATSS